MGRNKMNKFTAAASVALALVAGSAFAADLPSRKEAPVYVPPPPSFSWNGLYGGINIGYGFGDWQPGIRRHLAISLLPSSAQVDCA